MKLLPIKKTNNQQKIIDFVDALIHNHKIEDSDVNDNIISQIDLMVYKLYELTYDEVLVVEPEFSLSKQEYEAFTV